MKHLTERLQNDMEVVEDNGDILRVFDFASSPEDATRGSASQNSDFDSGPYNRITIRFSKDETVPAQLLIYEDRNNDPTEKMAFEMRTIEFSPISVIGKGPSNRLQGFSPTIGTYEDVPQEAMFAWNMCNCAVVPDGMEWVR